MSSDLAIIWKPHATSEIEYYSARADVWILNSTENRATVDRLRRKRKDINLTIGDYPHLSDSLEKLEAILDEALEHVRVPGNVIVVGYSKVNALDQVMLERFYSISYISGDARTYMQMFNN